MNFLTPLFLLGGAAILAPLIYHLVRRSTRERTVFSSLMFLMPSPPRISKRHRLQHILLLILRCLALLLLALGFARPFFREAPADNASAAQPKRTVVLVDTSASMRRDGLWATARERVDALLRQAGPSDYVALFTFDRQAVPLVSFEEWNRTAPGDRVAMVSSRLDTVAPGWGGTQLGAALTTAAEALTETEARGETGPRQIVLVSDLQEGSRLDTLQAYEWPKGIALSVEPLKARTSTNAGVQLIAEAADASRAAEPTVRVRVTNSADAKREQFKLGWANAAAGNATVGTPIDIYVPPGQSRVATIPVPKDAAADRIVLRGDDDPFDNTVYVIPPIQRQVNVLWLGRERDDDPRQPLFFLRRAFVDTPRLDVQVTARGAGGGAVTAEDVNAANLIFVSEPLASDAAQALRDRVEEGGTAVVVAKGIEVAPTLGALAGQPDLQLQEVQPRNYAMFAEIEFQHPVFAPFSDPRFSDFTKIHVWRYRQLDAAQIPDARVLAKFDSGDPAVVEIPVGRGRVFVLTTGWHPDDSQLAVSSKFVPLLWSLLELGGGAATAPTQFSVGDKVPLPAAERAITSVRTPGGVASPVEANVTDFSATTEPGVYAFATGANPVRFAVNLDANESRTAPLSFEELERMGVPLQQPKANAADSVAEAAQLHAAEAENRQKLWRWFIAATLLVLLIETALAGWTARRTVGQTAEATS